MKFDWIIKGGHVIDPANRIDGIRDVGVREGKIAAVAEKLDSSVAQNVFDATNRIVTPGLIDLHVHCYLYSTPLGVDPDHYCLGRGVTTAVDAGGAGCDTFMGMHRL